MLNKGLWAKLEAFLRYQHEHNEACEEMVIITGPVCTPDKLLISLTDNHCSIVSTLH